MTDPSMPRGGTHDPGPFVPPANWGLPPSFGHPKPAGLSSGAYDLGPGPDNPGTGSRTLEPLDPASIPHAGGLPYNESDIDRQARTYKGFRDSGTVPFRPPSPEVRKRVHELDAGASGADSSGGDTLKMDPDGLRSSAERMRVTGEGIQKLADKVAVGDGAAQCLPNTNVARACGRLDEALKKSFRDAGVWPQSSAAKLHAAVQEVHGADLEARNDLNQVRDQIAHP